MKTPPDKFTIRITEKDRKSAGPFICNRTKCLLETSLLRRGFKTAMALVTTTFINGVAFQHEKCDRAELHVSNNATRRPFYRKAVVGKRITFTRA